MPDFIKRLVNVQEHCGTIFFVFNVFKDFGTDPINLINDCMFWLKSKLMTWYDLVVPNYGFELLSFNIIGSKISSCKDLLT